MMYEDFVLKLIYENFYENSSNNVYNLTKYLIEWKNDSTLLQKKLFLNFS